MNEWTLYMIFGIAGGLAGFARFLRSERKWRWRTVIAATLVGSLVSITIIGAAFGKVAQENPWLCLSVSIAAGFGIPDLAVVGDAVLQAVIKARGVAPAWLI